MYRAFFTNMVNVKQAPYNYYRLSYCYTACGKHNNIQHKVPVWRIWQAGVWASAFPPEQVDTAMAQTRHEIHHRHQSRDQFQWLCWGHLLLPIHAWRFQPTSLCHTFSREWYVGTSFIQIVMIDNIISLEYSVPIDMFIKLSILLSTCEG